MSEYIVVIIIVIVVVVAVVDLLPVSLIFLLFQFNVMYNYVAVIFYFQLNFIFPLFQNHYHTILYTKTKEK